MKKMTTRSLKKILCIALAIILTVSLLPVTALATEGEGGGASDNVVLDDLTNDVNPAKGAPDEDDDADIIAMGSLPMGDVFLTQHSMISISFTCWKDERGS